MITLLECVLAQSLAMQCELLHVFRDRFAQILVDIEFGQILSEHESMSTQTCEQTDLWIDDVSWLDVVSRPHGMEAHRGEVVADEQRGDKHLAVAVEDVENAVDDTAPGDINLGPHFI